MQRVLSVIRNCDPPSSTHSPLATTTVHPSQPVQDSHAVGSLHPSSDTGPLHPTTDGFEGFSVSRFLGFLSFVILCDGPPFLFATPTSDLTYRLFFLKKTKKPISFY